MGGLIAKSSSRDPAWDELKLKDFSLDGIMKPSSEEDNLEGGGQQTHKEGVGWEIMDN